MKKILYIFLFASLVLSCAKDETILEYGNYTLTGFANTNNSTKTYFGTPDEDSHTIPFLWSEGDKIWCGNYTSTGVTISQDGKSAEFMLESEPQDGSIVYYNMNGSSSVSSYIPASQSISNSLGLNGDFGYGTISDDSFTLTHATSYLWFKVQGLPEGSVLKSITLYVAGSNIAGNAVWSGSSFTMPQLVTDNIELKVNASDLNDKNLVMVVYPVRMENPVVKYEVVKDDIITVYEHNLTTNNIASGNTYIITSDLSTLSNYNLRVLTFEDKAGDSYWANLIPAEDEQCYGGSELLYPSLFGSDYIYSWSDAYTKLEHKFPYNWNLYDFSGGGYAVSTHTGTMDELEIAYNAYSMYDYQLSIPLDEGHDNSENFCIGYHDSFLNLDDEIKPAICFSDGVPRVIDHMYVTNTSITMYSILNGSDFSSAFSDGDFLDIVATGYVGNVKGNSVRFRLADGDATIVDDWEKWDLSSLGAVTKVVFHMEENQTYDTGWNGLAYCSPLYFAFDDVAVRF